MVKRSKIITQQPKTIENPSIIDIKSVTVEDPKTSHILSKNIKQTRKVSQVTGLEKILLVLSIYSETKKCFLFL